MRVVSRQVAAEAPKGGVAPMTRRVLRIPPGRPGLPADRWYCEQCGRRGDELPVRPVGRVRAWRHVCRDGTRMMAVAR